jgi:hypothetical protein
MRLNCFYLIKRSSTRRSLSILRSFTLTTLVTGDKVRKKATSKEELKVALLEELVELLYTAVGFGRDQHATCFYTPDPVVLKTGERYQRRRQL